MGEPETVAAMLSFLYSGKIAADVVDPAKLLCLADRYSIDGLVHECLVGTLKKLSPDNVIAVTRALKSLKDEPEFAPMWADLQKRLKAEEELLAALICARGSVSIACLGRVVCSPGGSTRLNSRKRRP